MEVEIFYKFRDTRLRRIFLHDVVFHFKKKFSIYSKFEGLIIHGRVEYKHIHSPL